jgi:hypothetical protein
MSLNNAVFIIGAVALIFAYFFSVTLVGAAEAYVARWAGDDTPEEAGFLSLNPLNYMDIFGFACAVLVGFGWGRTVPFNPNNITGTDKGWKAFLVYMAQPFFSLILALVALIINVFLVGPYSLQFAFWNMFSKNIPLQQLAQVYPDRSSIILVIVVLLLSLIALNTFIATWSLINNSFHYLLFIGAEYGYDYMKHAEALAFFGPLVILILFTGPLRYMLLKLMVYLAYFIASICGACS